MRPGGWHSFGSDAGWCSRDRISITSFRPAAWKAHKKNREQSPARNAPKKQTNYDVRAKSKRASCLSLAIRRSWVPICAGARYSLICSCRKRNRRIARYPNRSTSLLFFPGVQTFWRRVGHTFDNGVKMVALNRSADIYRSLNGVTWSAESSRTWVIHAR